MAEKTKIEWTDCTFNPWIGCAEVTGHPGCAHCYAKTDMDIRRGRAKWGPKGTRSRTSDAYWKEPLKWNKQATATGKRLRVFCASLADVFEDWQGSIIDAQRRELARGGPGMVYPRQVPSDPPATMADLRSDLFDLIDKTPHLDWLLLTKRPENVPAMWPNHYPSDIPYRKNVWLGTSVSNQKTADKYLDKLKNCRELCPILFVSAEPILGPIQFHAGDLRLACPYCMLPNASPEQKVCTACNTRTRREIDWIIVGGESGSGARACDVAWCRDIVEQCRMWGTACFVKQLGYKAVDHVGDEKFPLMLNDKKGGDMDEWPADVQVREFPEVIER